MSLELHEYDAESRATRIKEERGIGRASETLRVEMADSDEGRGRPKMVGYVEMI